MMKNLFANQFPRNIKNEPTRPTLTIFQTHAISICLPFVLRAQGKTKLNGGPWWEEDQTKHYSKPSMPSHCVRFPSPLFSFPLISPICSPLCVFVSLSLVLLFRLGFDDFPLKRKALANCRHTNNTHPRRDAPCAKSPIENSWRTFFHLSFCCCALRT